MQAGRAYVVGEKRPELFVPGQSGHIVPSIPKAVMSPRGATGLDIGLAVDVDESGNRRQINSSDVAQLVEDN